jgi:group II intron reverse transcriptase/maturase
MEGNLETHRGQGARVHSDPRIEPTGIARVAAIARANPTLKFNNLMHHLTPELIRECISNVPNSSAEGVDGMTKEQVETNLSQLIPAALKDMHKGTYLAPPVQRVFIPKPDGKLRPIGIPTIFDRGCQAGMSKVLEGIYEQDFLSCSFGFRPGRGCHNALATMQDHLFKGKLNYVLEVDIRDFFGSLDHGWLRKFLRHRISDERVLKLIDSWLTAGVLDEGHYVTTEVGCPQGGSISPLLANIYLHYVLDLWWEKVIIPSLKGKAKLIRYCDDFVMIFESKEEAEGMLAQLRVRLAKFNLEISEAKTHLTDLSLRKTKGPRTRRRVDFLGFSIFRAKPRSGKGSKIVFQTQTSRFSRAKLKIKKRIKKNRHLPIVEQVNSINSVLRGHYNYYGFAGNMKRIQYFHFIAMRYFRLSLSRRSQKGYMSWERFKTEVLNVHKIEPPRIKVKYGDLNNLVMP